MTILDELMKREKSKILIIGSGFLATVVYTKLKSLKLDEFVDVLVPSNRKFWEDRLITEPKQKYDVVIDLKDDNCLYLILDISLEDNHCCNGGREKRYYNYIW